MAPRKKSKGGVKSAAVAKAARERANVQPITNMTESRPLPKHSSQRKPNNKGQQDTELAPKEKTELELESLVFGDSGDLIGETLGRVGHEMSEDEEEEEGEQGDDEQEEGEGMGDGSDMFFLDAGPTPLEDETLDNLGHAKMSMEVGGEDSDEEGMEDMGDGASSDEDDYNESRLAELFGGKPAWVDEDDKALVVSLTSVNRLKKLRKEESEDVVNGIDYEQRLRRQFEKVYPVPNWAHPDGSRKRGRDTGDSDSEYSDEEEIQEGNSIAALLKTSKGFTDKSRGHRILSSESISVTRVKNANQAGYSKAVVQSVEFHPNSQMLLTAGFDKTLRLFQVDGKMNHMMQSVLYRDLPIYKAAFSATGKYVVATGRRKYFYVYDLEAGRVDKSQGIYGRQEKSLEKFSLSPCGEWIAFLGRDGHIILVSMRTRLWVKNLKMNGNVRAVAWSSDSKFLFSVGGDAEIYQWNVGSGKVAHRFLDEGGFKPTCIAVSPNDEFVAVGSKTGIVNVYDRTCLKTRNPRSLRAIGNLTTSITILKFNHDSQILAIASKSRKDQLKLVHIPSLKVFPNWPTRGTPLSYVTDLSFSPRSGYLAIGNDKGRVLLYRLNHYASA
ncbi:U3 snoRNP protein [Lunasporangiospora selenospora]|uniref:U3 small nucleolar RNA-associated protein 18 homolog n=1 Tax=Lunasporangiospora selenospora TaxID=979761 RepID=A0A9P6FX01_9FUNG|nr:U3 snoRNP protein [Lunasporangiospora selenospora]